MLGFTLGVLHSMSFDKCIKHVFTIVVSCKIISFATLNSSCVPSIHLFLSLALGNQ